MRPLVKDAKLDRLLTARDLAFYDQQSAWKCLGDARRALNQARTTKQRAYETQESTRQTCRDIRSVIEQCDRRSERNLNQKELQKLSNEHHKLEERLARAEELHRRVVQTFQDTKDNFYCVRQDFNVAKLEHERMLDILRRAEAKYNRAKRGTSSPKPRHKASIIDEHVPPQYRNNVDIKEDPYGNTHLYFGGRNGDPCGPQHGHYVIQSGKVIYGRDPGQPHGPQNYRGSCKREA